MMAEGSANVDSIPKSVKSEQKHQTDVQELLSNHASWVLGALLV